jgi:hypothetical protein
VRLQTLMEGRIQFKVGAEDRRLLDELALQARDNPRARHSAISIADVLIPLIEAWCRSPRRSRGARIQGKPERVDLRLNFPQTLICRKFAGMLQERGEKNASAVLRAILHDHIDPKRIQLQADVRRREKATKQRQYRAARRISIADAIELFLPELGERYTARAAEQADRDADALFKLGRQLACHLATIMRAKKHHDPRFWKTTYQFADKFVGILGWTLPKASVSQEEAGSDFVPLIRRARDN